MLRFKSALDGALALILAARFVLLVSVDQVQASDDPIDVRIEELAQVRPDEISYELLPLLLDWGGHSDPDGDYGTPPFGDLTTRDQADAVVAVIEAHHAAYREYVERPANEVLAVLLAAQAVAKPSDVFDHDGRSDHPILSDVEPAELRLLLGAQPMGEEGLGNLFRDALRRAWRDYTGRADLSGMMGEEAPSDFERWLFDARDKTTLCEPGEAVFWSCPGSQAGEVYSICLDPDAGQLQFRAGIPGLVLDVYPASEPAPGEGFSLVPSGTRGETLLIGDQEDGYTISAYPDYYDHIVERGDSSSFMCEPTTNRLDDLRSYLADPSTFDGTEPSGVEPDIPALCPAGSAAGWACQASDSRTVDALCVSEGSGERLVQFRSGEPGDTEPWTLPAQPAPVSEVMDFWVNDGVLVSHLENGPQSITFLRSDGPMGTDGRVSSAFNLEPGAPRDCAILTDHMGRLFGHLVPCADRFDAAACPDGEILPHSDSRPLLLHELRGLTEDALYLAQHEILARHGQRLHDPVEAAHFEARRWYRSGGGDVPMSILAPVEQDNFGMILEQLQIYRAADAAQWRLPAAWGQWQGRFVLDDGSTGTLSGSDHRLRADFQATGQGWLYLPREDEVYLFSLYDAYGVVEPGWRLPWLLSTEILRELDVLVESERDETIAGEETTCFDLAGRDVVDRWLEGELCLTGDGVPMRVDLKGEHDLEGQEDMLPWSYFHEMTSFYRETQREVLFGPPAEIDVWNRPG